MSNQNKGKVFLPVNYMDFYLCPAPFLLPVEISKSPLGGILVFAGFP